MHRPTSRRTREKAARAAPVPRTRGPPQMSVQSTRVTRHNSKSRPAAPQARARQLGSPPVTKPTRNPRAKTSPSSKSSSSTNNAQSNGSANNLISNLQQQVSQTLLSLLAVSLLFPCGPLAASLLPLCCLLAASL